ncbi:TPA: hypothetical protein DDZ75_00995 [Patescibacteria group bacterium]|nr:hypothetical protein [Patescibacteria group bacterium]
MKQSNPGFYIKNNQNKKVFKESKNRSQIFCFAKFHDPASAPLLAEGAPLPAFDSPYPLQK